MDQTEKAKRLCGFRKLREGRIHLRCPQCGRKMSNVPRIGGEPESAVLCEVICPRCDNGYKDATQSLYDASGNYVNWEWED